MGTCGFDMRIALVSSEAVPFAKTGGLADVAGALPKALARLGHRAAVFLPCHRSAWSCGVELAATGVSLRVPIGQHWVEGNLFEAPLGEDGATAYLIDQPEYYDRPNLYGENGRDYHDNSQRFIFFCRAVLEALRALDFQPDIIHCNDWQSGLIPIYLREQPALLNSSKPANRVGTLMTIHNMAYQGEFSKLDMPLTGLPWSLFHWQALECRDHLNFLKAGLSYSDMISTVSPTYAREIQSIQYGCGLDGLLRHRSHDLRGVLNGIDDQEWNPRLDPHIAKKYNEHTFLGGKAACKAALQRRASLPERPEVPLIGAIGRLDSQKGWDLIADVIPEMLHHDLQFVFLGVGHERYHYLLDDLASRHGDKLRTFLQFSPELSHQIEAGVDMFLMPSLYEPCGLNQMYSQVYGTPPIVRYTGGLADTVCHASWENIHNGQATGFLFGDINPEAFRQALWQALDLFNQHRDSWNRVVYHGMTRDFSWNRSAQTYTQLYEEIQKRRH